MLHTENCQLFADYMPLGNILQLKMHLAPSLALAGILTAAIEFPPEGRMIIPLVIGGGWLFAQGGWSLIRYLHSHPNSKAPEHTRL